MALLLLGRTGLLQTAQQPRALRRIASGLRIDRGEHGANCGLGMPRVESFGLIRVVGAGNIVFVRRMIASLDRFGGDAGQRHHGAAAAQPAVNAAPLAHAAAGHGVQHIQRPVALSGHVRTDPRP
jgi:hypothetical protein